MVIKSDGITLPGGTQRIGYIDALRGFTMFLVVLEHVASMCWGIVGKGISIHDYLSQVRMPLFFFISGFVLYKEGVVWNASHIVKFFKKKIPVQLISPFIFFAVFVYLHHVTVWEGLMEKQKMGYWFTLVLLEFFVIYAAVRFAVRRRWYKVILIAIGLVLYYYCWPSLTTGVQRIDNLFLLLSVHQWRFFIFFVLGTLVKEHFETIQRWLDSKWMLAACITFYLLGNVLGSIPLFQSIPVKFLLSLAGLAAVFSFFRSKQALFARENVLGRTMQYVGRRTLDIYLIHYFLIPVGLNGFVTVFTDHPMPIIEAFTSSVIAIIIMAACLLVSEIIRLSPWLAHWLFGAKTKN